MVGLGLELANVGETRRAGDGRRRQERRDGASVIEESMREYLIERGALVWIRLEYLADEIFTFCRNKYIFLRDNRVPYREGVGVSLDATVGGLHIISFERRLANEHSIEDHSE